MAEEAKQAQIRFKISADGAKETADSLERVTQVLDRQAAEVKAVAQANEAAEARYAAFRAEADKANATHGKTVEVFGKAGQAANDNAKAIQINTNAVKDNAAKFAELGGTVSRAFAQVSPAVAQFQGVLDPVLRSLAGTVGILGGAGGVGVAAGGVIALVTGLGAAFGAAAKEADAMAKQTLENSKALGTYMQQIGSLRSMVGSRIAANVGESQTKQRLESGRGSGDEYAREVAALKELSGKREEVDKALLAAQQQLASISPRNFTEPGALDKAVAAANEEIRRLAELKNAIAAAPGQIARYQKFGSAARAYDAESAALNKQGKQDKFEQDAYLEEHGMPGSGSGTPVKRDDNFDWEKRESANRAAIAAIDKMQAEARAKEAARVEAEQKATFQREFTDRKDQIEQIQRQFKEAEINKTALLNTNLDEQRAAYEQKIAETLGTIHTNDAEQAVQVEIAKREAFRETYDEYMKLEEMKAAQVAQNIAQEKRDRGQMTQSLMALGTTAAQLTAKQLSEAVKGHKIQGAMILESLGDAMVAEGVRVMFQGAAMSLMGNFASGGGLLALGAAEMAVGLGLGAAGSAMQPPTASAGAAPEAGASPIRDTSASSNGDSGRGPTVIYIDMPTVVSPSPEDGLRIRQAIDAASRVYGAPV